MSASASRSPNIFRQVFRRALVIVHRSILIQIGVLSLFWKVGEGVVRLSGLPIPGGVVGLAVVLALLASGRIRPASVRLGARWLLAEMLLFFVPAVMAVLDHREFVGLLGLKIAVVIIAGTVMVMASTAITVDLLYRWRTRHAGA